MGDKLQVACFKDEDAAEEDIFMEFKPILDVKEEVVTSNGITDVKEGNTMRILSLHSPDLNTEVSMDINGVLTRDKLTTELFKCVAVWSSDTRRGAMDIIPLIAKYGDIEDVKDQWAGKQLTRWNGLVAVFHDCSNAITAAQELPKQIIDGQWCIKAFNIGEWLNRICAIEHGLNETDLKYHVTLVCVHNVHETATADKLRPSCEAFGPVVDISPVFVADQKVAYFVVKYVYSADAYAAKWYMDGRPSGERKMEVSIVMTPKIAAIEREIVKNDMVLWDKS